ncbi:MAG: hypothetical protein MPJ50_19220 [Pirellulales bacterium]|nr:hypothetical protein [Pirellulales bacterium]
MQFRNQGVLQGIIAKKEVRGEGSDKFYLVAIAYEQFRDPFDFYLGKRLYDQCPDEGEAVEVAYELQAKPTVAGDRAKTVIKPRVTQISPAGAVAGSVGRDAESTPRRRQAA